jgi:cation diffusion facilitator CzcD-associated flavoprotein CzcO
MTDDTSAKYAIIGAGAAGLTAAKNLKTFGIPFDIFEREDDVGGTWYYGTPASAAYKSTHLISSKPMSAFLDYPMPTHYPDYPRHDQVHAYLRDYAQHFGIYDQIAFNTTVEQVERTENGLWEVAYRKIPEGEIQHQSDEGVSTQTYGGVIIANGHLWDSRLPEYPGHFDGISLHSKDYKTPDVLRDKHVLVVGAGNSGCDIAVEAAQNALRVFHSTRRGYHYIPKYIMGIPTDQVAEPAIRLGVPVAVRRVFNQFMINLVLGSPERFGLPKPDHHLLESHPIVNSQMLYYVGHGDITPKPDIEQLCGDRVRFIDGSEEAIDLIIYATGFKISIPFIDPRHLNWQNGAPRLYLHAFHPDYDNLFVVGLLQPDSGVFPLMDYQAQLIARFIHAQIHAPDKAAEFHQRKAGEPPKIRAHVIDTARHLLEIDHGVYRRQVRRLIAAFER